MLVTGPRQSGETTLLREHFGETHRYRSLESLDVRERAAADPVEIKATSTPRPAHASQLTGFRKLAGERAGAGLLVADVPDAFSLVPRVQVLPWNGL